METSNDVLDAIRDHAADAYPEEACGFLLGSVTDAGRNRVTAVRRVTNRHPDHRERRYRISADDYRAAEADARARDLDVVGFYHSHPDHPAHPSETDLHEATFPGYTYVIVSVHDGTPDVITAWSLTPDRSHFEREGIAVTVEESE